MGKSPRTGTALATHVFKKGNKSDPGNYMYRPIMLLFTWVCYADDWSNTAATRNKHPISKNRNNELQTRILIWNIFLYEPIHYITRQPVFGFPTRYDTLGLTQTRLHNSRVKFRIQERLKRDCTSFVVKSRALHDHLRSY